MHAPDPGTHDPTTLPLVRGLEAARLEGAR